MPMASVDTLIEALPYIREFRGETFIVRCAGELHAGEQEALSRDIGILRFAGVKAVVVHAHDATGADESLPLGQRGVNHRLVHAIGAYGKATGLAGSDGAPRWLLSAVGDDELVVDPDLVLHVLDDYTPVIEAVAVGASGEAVPADADLVAARLAIALKAYKVLFVVGDHRVIVEAPDGKKEMPVTKGPMSATSGEISEMRATPDVISRVKLDPELKKPFEAALEAIDSGEVVFAHLIPNDLPHGLLLELFTDLGYGTKIRSAASWAEEEKREKEPFPARGYWCWDSDPQEDQA